MFTWFSPFVWVLLHTCIAKVYLRSFCFPWKMVSSHYLATRSDFPITSLSGKLPPTSTPRSSYLTLRLQIKHVPAGSCMIALRKQLQAARKLQLPRGSAMIDKFAPQAADEKHHRILYDFVVLFKWQFVCINGYFAAFFLIHKFQTIKQKVAKYFLLAR